MSNLDATKNNLCRKPEENFHNVTQWNKRVETTVAAVNSTGWAIIELQAILSLDCLRRLINWAIDGRHRCPALTFQCSFCCRRPCCYSVA